MYIKKTLRGKKGRVSTDAARKPASLADEVDKTRRDIFTNNNDT